MDIYQTDFKPTYLYVKRNDNTGLLYFGKTTCSLEYLLKKYKGSGKYWIDHCKKHGWNVSTLWYEFFHTREEIEEFALFFSEFFDIVESPRWANYIPENGIGLIITESIKKKISISRNNKVSAKTKETGEYVTITRQEFNSGNYVGVNKGRKLGPQSRDDRLKKSKAHIGKSKPLNICRLSDRKEMYTGHFMNWCKYEDGYRQNRSKT